LNDGGLHVSDRPHAGRCKIESPLLAVVWLVLARDSTSAWRNAASSMEQTTTFRFHVVALPCGIAQLEKHCARDEDTKSGPG